MTYVEGASLHQERGGATVFARYAFNELWSFIAGWAILLDYVILIAIARSRRRDYLAAFWSPLGARRRRVAGRAPAIIAYVGVAQHPRLRRRRATTRVGARRASATSSLQLVIVVLGLVLVLRPRRADRPDRTAARRRPGRPRSSRSTLAIGRVHRPRVGLGAGRRGRGRPARPAAAGRRRARPRRSSCTSASRWSPSRRCPSRRATRARPEYVEAPMLGVVDAFDPTWLRDALRVRGRGRRRP